MLHSFSRFGGIMRSTYTCVIISWDAKCQASEEMICDMDIRSLSRGTDQPFYHILTDDGKTLYAAEGNYWNCRYAVANLHHVNVCIFTRFVRNISFRPPTSVKPCRYWCVLWWIRRPKVRPERRADGDVPRWRGRRFISARKITIISFTFHVLCSRVPCL